MSWDYTEQVKNLFHNAVEGKEGSHIGEIKDPDGVGEHGSIICGDAITFYFKVERASDPLQDRIIQLRYKTFGCTSAIASSEALCLLIEERKLTPLQALQITNQDIVDYLGGLPEQKIHCSVMGAEVLLAAVKDWAKKRNVKLADSKAHSDEMEEGEVVCECFNLTRPFLTRKIQELNLTTLEEIKNSTKAGGGCGTCAYIPRGLEDLLQSLKGHTSATDTAPVFNCTKEQIESLYLELFSKRVHALGEPFILKKIKSDKIYFELSKEELSVEENALLKEIEKTFQDKLSPLIRVIDI